MAQKKIILIAGSCAALAAALLFAYPASSVRAAAVAEAASTSSSPSAVATSSSSGHTPDDCGITADDIAKIAAVKNDPTLTPSQELVQELAVRKQLITQVITCAQGEVSALRSVLATAPATSTVAKAIADQLGGRLDDADNFYSIELGKLDGAGISGSESVASEVLSWRQGSYASLAGQVSDFVLWSENQGLFVTAENRMNQTQQAVSFIESAAGNANLQSAFNSAYASFQEAKQDNGSAQDALSQGLPPDQSLAIIKQSLDALSNTYQQFFKVSSIIQSLLPQ